jgi:hypothetical protein
MFTNSFILMRKIKVKNIETAFGNSLLKSLVQVNGWRIQSQYDEDSFDKGIDFDRYVIEKEDIELIFEWTNWFEWEISGDQTTIEKLSQCYDFEIKE